MSWTIVGDARATPSGGYDGSVWEWQIADRDDPGRQDFVIVRITGTAMAMGKEALRERAGLARETVGRSEVEAVLDWPVPPSEIEISSEGVSRAGGNPGPEQLEVSRIMDWFTSRGASVFLIGRRVHGASARERTPHTAYVTLRDSDGIMFKTQGDTYLEAARAAQGKWEDDGLGTYIELSPAEGRSSTSLSIETGRPEIDADQKASEASTASRSESFSLSWEPAPGSGIEGNPVHILQVRDGNGDLLDISFGDDPEDSLLEVAEHLLPSWTTPPEE